MLLPLASAVALVACTATDGGQSTDGTVCASVMHFAEPVLTVTQVVGPDGRDVPRVEITDLRLDGRPALGSLRRQVPVDT